MAQEVTDPAILAQLNAGGDDPPPAAPDAPAPKEVKDPALLAQLNAVPIPGKPGTGASGGWEAPQDKLPFGDDVAMQRASNFEEKELYMQNRYGKGNVSREWGEDGTPVLVVKTDKGSTYRIGGDGAKSFVAKIAGDSPVLGGMIVGAERGATLGAEYGAEAGPEGAAAGATLGAIGGAGVGAVAAQLGVEGEKFVKGDYHKTPGQLATTLLGANKEGEEAELGGRAVGRAVTEIGSAHLPRFITGATADTDKMTRQAWAAGARPSAAAFAPDMKKLARTESLAEKTVGRAAYQDERNMAFIKSTVADTLKANGVPGHYVDSFMQQMDDPAQAYDHNGIGEDLQASVKAHIDSLEATVNKTRELAQSHVDAQLKNVSKVIDDTKEVDLTGKVGQMVDSAYNDFTGAASGMYDKAFSMVGKKPVVPVDVFAKEAEDLVSAIRETKVGQVPGIIQRMSQQAGRQLSERDALLLNEFGIEIPDTGKMTLEGAQRLRTQLRTMARGGQTVKLTHSTNEHDFGVMADAVDSAIKASYADPAVRPAVKALESADSFYEEGINKFKDVEVKKLFKLARAEYPLDPEGVVRVLTAPGYSSRTSDIRRVIGEPVWKGVQSAHMRQFLSKFVDRDPEGKPTVDGVGILGMLRADSGDRALKTFEAVHGADAVKELREMAEIAAAHKGVFPVDMVTKEGPKMALRSMKLAEARRDEFMEKNALKILADPKLTGEEAYQFVAEPGPNSERNLMAAAKLFGINSPQMRGLQQAALEHVARNANIAAVTSRGNQPIEAALSAYTPNQMKLLFPNGMARDLRQVSKVIEYMFKKESGKTADATAPSLAAGAILSLPFVARIPIQATQAVMRFIILHPAFARFITIGHDEGEPWLRRTAETFKQMATLSSAEASKPDNNQTSQQPPTAMPGPPTIQ
jgi:hypothetical protein